MPKFSAVEKVRNLGSRRESLIGTLVLLALAANCAAAPGTPVGSGLTSASPGGIIFTAECVQVGSACNLTGVTQTWVTDVAMGFCRLNVDASGASQLTNCLKPTNALFGQPAFDGSFLYLPDYNNGAHGVWRYDWDGLVFDKLNNAINLSVANTSNHTAVALAPDGTLFVTLK